MIEHIVGLSIKNVITIFLLEKMLSYFQLQNVIGLISLNPYKLFILLFVTIVCSCKAYTVNDLGEKTINFSNYVCTIKESNVPKGPRDNLWTAKNICIDNGGNLELSISKRGEKWYSSELFIPTHFGYGSYSFTIDSPVHNLDENAVLGLFVYESDTQEIDIEFQRHVHPTKNVAFTVQKIRQDQDTVQQSFILNTSGSVHLSFDWSKNLIHFKASTENGQLISEFIVIEEEHIPHPDKELVRINYYLFYPDRGLSDTNKHSITISHFTFIKQL